METKFTKGKWKRIKLPKTNYYPERNEIQYGKDGECVAEFVANDYDALLISKAPEMFEMIQELLKELSFHGYNNSTTIYNAKQLLKEVTEI